MRKGFSLVELSNRASGRLKAEQARTQGFSLVELSIVLVILGLLTGGILAGQNLIRAAELRSVSTEYSRYYTAVQTFRDKYFAIPGDFNEATKFWGQAAAGASCATTSTGDERTCDGDGDGLYETIGSVTGGTSHELFRFWQHLANAGLIEGSYTGIQASGGVNHSVGGENVPKSKLNQGTWNISNWDSPGGNANNFDIAYGQHLTFGKESSGGGSGQPVLTPEEAWNIDTKSDDGLPGRGKVTAIYWNTCTDANLSSELDAEYLYTDTAVRCAFRMLLR